MATWQYYHNSSTTNDALKVLKNTSESVKIISGGTDLLLDIQQGRHEEVHTLVDVNTVPTMHVLEILDGYLHIGAANLHRVIAQSPLVKEHAAALATASGLIGGPQVRNIGTIGGNVAHALPAADGTIALLCLNAQADIASSNGFRQVPMAELFLGPGKSALKPKEEILTGFDIALRKKGEGSAFNRTMRPQGVAIAILNLAVWISMRADVIADIRIAAGPTGPVPRRLTAAENALRGKTITDKTIAGAYEAATGEVQLRTSRHRATQAYRQDVLGNLLEKTIREAAVNAGVKL
ncbi:MAG: hypothetical protein B0D92_04685 [Spirochaeta sp. LUC14_002_19_P3]|nr:MAG: hypothetical protein B0D92_04685 [Spirochaeta sp. LUC14_002_19_P3]